jgi:hypothetical protein
VQKVSARNRQGTNLAHLMRRVTRRHKYFRPTEILTISVRRKYLSAWSRVKPFSFNKFCGSSKLNCRFCLKSWRFQVEWSRLCRFPSTITFQKSVSAWSMLITDNLSDFNQRRATADHFRPDFKHEFYHDYLHRRATYLVDSYNANFNNLTVKITSQTREWCNWSTIHQ